MDSDVAATLLITSAVGGVTGAFVKELTGKGVEWLIQLVAAHSPAVQEKAKKNMENFVYRLADRVERLEHELPVQEHSAIMEAMDHPSTAFLISDAMKNSAMTDNEEHHALLAELIAQRLGAGADDMITLVGTAACDVVNCLSITQINLLALLVILHDIRPLEKLNSFEESEGNSKQASQSICEWWEAHLSPILNIFSFSQINALDLDHIVAMRCGRFRGFMNSLNTMLSQGFFGTNFSINKDVIKNFSFYDELEAKKDLIGSMHLTSIGKLIGILHHDGIVKKKTVIKW